MLIFILLYYSLAVEVNKVNAKFGFETRLLGELSLKFNYLWLNRSFMHLINNIIYFMYISKQDLSFMQLKYFSYFKLSQSKSNENQELTKLISNLYLFNRAKIICR